MGIPAGCVHSKRGGSRCYGPVSVRLRALVNNNILTTGYDDPTVDMIVVLRPTMSTVLWVPDARA